ncbi:MAG: DUF2203 family protein [Pirellulales bacterium]|jgi:hypothetical protein
MKTASSKNKNFTIRTANLTLPLVKMIVQDIVVLSKEVSETRERLDYLGGGRGGGTQDDDYGRELDSIEQTTKLKSDKLGKFANELTQLQLGAAQVNQGYVDFPAMREGESVSLCWHLGDKEVLYWHPADEDCQMRRPVDLPLIRQSGDRSYSNS